MLQVRTLPFTLNHAHHQGKTCSLLSAALEIGAFLGGADEHTCKKFRQTGQILGEAYQVQDDWLGIWGNDALTGKSIESDLISKKKTFPILTGIELDQAFAKKWVSKETITASDIQGLIQALNDDGIKKITEERFDSLYQQTIKELDSTECAGAAISPLKTIINQLLKRIQ